MKQLIPMIDYFLETVEWIKENDKVEKEKAFTRSIAIDRLTNYAKFLKQKPELFMFVPCDDNNVPLDKEAIRIQAKQAIDKGANRDVVDGIQQVYWDAESRVLFEGCRVETDSKGNIYLFKEGRQLGIWHKGADSIHFVHPIKTVENLIDCNLTLSETALNLINSK